MILLIGILGLVLLLTAFTLDALDIVSDDSRVFYALNVAGSGLLVWYSYMIASIPFLVLESFWVLVSFIKLCGAKK